MSKMNKSEHNEMKGHLISAALNLAVNGDVAAHEISERVDALRKVLEEVVTLEPEQDAYCFLSAPKPGEYDGLDERSASRKAHNLTVAAAYTGQTKLLHQHLQLLVPRMKQENTRCGT
jgi:hypothetical protein